MGKSIDLRGFGVIELLVVTVVILLIAIQATRMLRKQEAPAAKSVGPLEAALRKDLEEGAGLQIVEFGKNGVAGSHGTDRFSYELRGTPPMREVVRVSSQGSNSLLDHAVAMEWTAYDEKNFTLPDDVPADRIKDIRRIRVTVIIHDPEESRDFYINDRTRGIDLDGDPGNGVAKAHERTFGIVLPTTK